jgi:hypothetical protein
MAWRLARTNLPYQQATVVVTGHDLDERRAVLVRPGRL